MSYQLVYVFMHIVNKYCLLHLKVSKIFDNISFLLEKYRFCLKKFNFNLVFYSFLILLWFVRDPIQEQSLNFFEFLLQKNSAKIQLKM